MQCELSSNWLLPQIVHAVWKQQWSNDFLFKLSNDSFWRGASNQKNEPEAFKKNDAFTRGVFRVGVHTHIGALCLVMRR